MNVIVNILRNSQLMLAISIVVAFLMPQYGEALKPAVLPLLMFMMLFSMKTMKTPKLSKKNFVFGFKNLFLNYVVFSGILLIASLFIADKDYSIPFKMLACGPPAVLVITLAYLSKADVKKAMFTETLAYFFALIYTPLMVFFIFGSSVNIVELIKVLILLIIIPFIVSRFMHNNIKYDFKEAINIILFFNIYIGIALSRDTIMQNYMSLVPVIIVFVILIFLPMTVAYYLTKNQPKKIAPLYVLFASQKNGNFALGLCLLFFSPKTIVPLAIYAFLSAFYVMYFLWLYRIKRK